MNSSPRSLGQQRKEIETCIDFVVRCATLDLREVTRLLGMEPTWGFEPGAVYTGKIKIGDEIREIEKRRPSFGVWHLETGALMESSVLQDHGPIFTG